MDRFFIISLPAYLLLLGLVVLRLPRCLMQVALPAVLVAGSVVGTIRVHADPSLRKDDWRQAMAIIKSYRQPDDLVVLVMPTDTVPATYYAHQDLAPWSYLAKWSHLKTGVEADPWSSVLVESHCDRLWLVYVDPHGSNHLMAKELLPFEVYRDADLYTQAWLNVHREEVIEEWSLTGLTLLLVQLAQWPGRLYNRKSKLEGTRFRWRMILAWKRTLSSYRPTTNGRTSAYWYMTSWSWTSGRKSSS